MSDKDDRRGDDRARPLLAVRGLNVSFRGARGPLPVVRDLTFAIEAGERAALVGESGCGKSMTCLALTRLPPTDEATLSGEIFFQGAAVAGDTAAMARLRGRHIAYVFQDPAGSLNPVMRIGAQIVEVLRMTHGRPAPRAGWRAIAARGGAAAARTRALDLLARVRLPDPAAILRAYPCELSGGMQQRAMLAMALACEPQLLVADEPTTALDVTVQAQVLAVLAKRQAETGAAVILITHDLGVVAETADRVAVMYGGRIVETGDVADIFRAPRHPYTAALITSTPEGEVERLSAIPGAVPQPWAMPPGCRFAPRCAMAQPACATTAPALEDVAPGRAARCLRWREFA